MEKSARATLWFADVTNDDVALVGGKNASLGEMYQTLTGKGIRVPNGFIITAKAYRDYVAETGLMEKVRHALDGLDTKNMRDLQKRGKAVRKLFLSTPLPRSLTDEIATCYAELETFCKQKDVDVAVRSSATAEDLPGASFAGEHETFLNIRGPKAVAKATQAAFASLFTDRAISYRVDKGFDHFSIALSVGVQKMVRSDKGASGVLFTLDTETGFRGIVEVTSAYGLGEMVVQGKTTPDEFIVFKEALKAGKDAIIRRTLGEKKAMMIYGTTRTPTKEIATPAKLATQFSISDDEARTLALWGVMIEDHYSARAGHPMPMDIEWAKDGITGELFIVQARPETVQAEKKGLTLTEYSLKGKAPEPIAKGIPVGAKITAGKVRALFSTTKLNEFKDGEVLVTEITDPDWEPIMKKASAIITAKGGRTSHAAIVSRELGIPAIVGIGMEDMLKLKTGTPVTVDGANGSVGYVYPGILEWTEKTEDLGDMPTPRTKVSLNIGSPEAGFAAWRIPHTGVGLAREEFIIASQIGIHPNALIDFATLPPALKKKIEAKTAGYADKTEYFVRTLAEGVAAIAAASHPHDVIVRFSDFKTNEYRTLLGGEAYEPTEENPMIGWRGASRYHDPKFAAAFGLECRAMKMAREVIGLENVHVMVPFCRTPEEADQVLAVMKKHGLVRGENGLKVFVMCEIPTNVLRADEFLERFDGFSIGSNDLTQLTLGLDRDSGILAHIGNENDPAVRTLISMAIRAAKKHKKYIGICGQAPSDFPDFLRFLIREGIDAVSLNPDSAIRMTRVIAAEEEAMDRA